MKLKIVEHLAKHPFIKAAMDDIKPQLDKIYPEVLKRAEDGDWISKSESKMGDADWYRYDVFSKQTALISVLDRIVYAHAFLEKFPSPRTFEKEYEITQYIWIEYHFFHYMVNVVSLFDCLLILTNAVFRIGLKERACKPDTILKNHWVWQVGFDKYLKKFESITNKYKETRNIHLHRGKGKNIAQVLNSDNLSFLGMVSFLQLHKDEFLPKDIIDAGYKEEVVEISNRIEADCHEIEDQLSEIFSFLIKIYLNKRPEINT